MILVVGGAGYIGSHVVKDLVANGYECIVADNLSYGHLEALKQDISFIQADLLDKASLRKVFQSYNIDAVMHFAAFAYVGESVENPLKYYQNNVAGTLNLLDVMLEHDVNKIVFSSTCATYGNPEYTPIDEAHPQNPINPYGRSKLMMEQILEDFHKAYGFKYIALRYFNAAGGSPDGDIGESHNPETHLIPIVLEVLRGVRQQMKIFGTDYETKDGTCIRDYIHVDDLASAHRLALEKLDEYCGYLNLGTGIETSVKDIIAAAEKVAGQKCNVEYGPRRPGDPAVLYADNKKAKQILNWQPQYLQIEDIIATAWNWTQNKLF